MQAEYLKEGQALPDGGKPIEAVEPLRKAYVFADRLLGIRAPETLLAKEVWDRSRDEAALAQRTLPAG